MTKAEAFCKRIDAVNKWAGIIASMLLLPLVGIVMIEVILRYFFKAPTIWAWDINVQLAAVIAIMAGGYGLLSGGHVSVDLISGHLSPKAKARLDLATSIIFFFVMVTLIWVASLSRKTQVIFFTHHRHLVELAEASIDPGLLFKHALEGPH